MVDVWEAVSAPHVRCQNCGAQTERAWLTKPPNVIGDEIDFVSHNGERHPRRFRSKQEHKRWLKANGFTIKDAHVGSVGSDKSPHSEVWATGGTQWLADAEALAKANHNGTFAGNTPEPPPDRFHIRWSSGDATPEMIEANRSR